MSWRYCIVIEQSCATPSLGKKAILYINDKQVSLEDKPVDIELKRGHSGALREKKLDTETHPCCQVSTSSVLTTSATATRSMAWSLFD